MTKMTELLPSKLDYCLPVLPRFPAGSLQSDASSWRAEPQAPSSCPPASVGESTASEAVSSVWLTCHKQAFLLGKVWRERVEEAIATFVHVSIPRGKRRTEACWKHTHLKKGELKQWLPTHHHHSFPLKKGNLLPKRVLKHGWTTTTSNLPSAF